MRGLSTLVSVLLLEDVQVQSSHLHGSSVHLLFGKSELVPTDLLQLQQSLTGWAIRTTCLCLSRCQ